MSVANKTNRASAEASVRMSPQEKAAIDKMFSLYVNKGQVNYLKAGHLDVLEHDRNGIRFQDPVSGKIMIDCFSSAGSFNVGRKNPVMLKALSEAADSLDMGSFNLTSRYKTALAKELATIAPGDMNRVLFAAGGGDAIDCAIKLALGATGRKEIISTIKAYHGHTGFALSANGKEHYRKYFEPLMPSFSFVPFNDLDAMKKAVTNDTAAVIIEPVQGEAGIFVATDAYLKGLREICNENGALLILDEIQTGFGRTGKMFAAEHSCIVADIMTIGKSLSGGLFPNAAVIYRDVDILNGYIRKNPGFHTPYVGGSDLACCVSLSVIEYIQKENLCANSRLMGEKLKQALLELKKENEKIIKEVRGIGLMIGIEYIHEFMGPMMTDALAQNGVFAVYSGNAPQVMRFMLPIVASEKDVDEVILAVRNSVKSMKILLPLALPAAKIPGVLKLLNNEAVQTVVFNWIRSAEDLYNKIFKKNGVHHNE